MDNSARPGLRVGHVRRRPGALSDIAVRFSLADSQKRVELLAGRATRPTPGLGMASIPGLPPLPTTARDPNISRAALVMMACLGAGRDLRFGRPRRCLAAIKQT